MPVEHPGLLLTTGAFALTIGVLVFVHELGHYGVARLFGIRAERFAIGFGPELTGWTDGRGTRWSIGILPIGGFVQFAGDADAVGAPADATGVSEADWLQCRPVWQRFLVVLAGPMTNFLLVIAIMAGFAAIYGDLVAPARVASVIAGSPAQTMGIRPGDLITRFQGSTVDGFEALQRQIMLRPGVRVTLTVQRNGTAISLAGTVGNATERDPTGQVHHIGRLGIVAVRPTIRSVSLLEAPLVGLRQTVALTVTTLDGLRAIVAQRISVHELGGPLKIAQLSGQQLAAGWNDYIGFVALISINLGFINLLPIPMLDGGHLLLYVVEALRGRPAAARTQEWAFRVGLALVSAVMLFVTINDIASFGLFGH